MMLEELENSQSESSNSDSGSSSGSGSSSASSSGSEDVEVDDLEEVDLDDFSNLEVEDEGIVYDEEQCDAEKSDDEGECTVEGEGLIQLADDELKDTGITNLTDS